MAYTTIDDPTTFFNTILYTGNDASNRGITGVNFAPNWVWIKKRNHAAGGVISDTVRGAGKVLYSSETNAEGSESASFVSFDSDGYTISQDAGVGLNVNGHTYVGWQWKAGGSASNNTDGTTTVSLSVNLTAGFSIGTYTGTSAAATIGHGLGAVPHWIMIKNRSSGSRKWAIWHNDLSGTNKYLAIDRNDAELTDTATWNNTSHTSSVFASAGSGEVNQGSENFVFYAFKPIKGYSKFGSYTGNGNADGTFVYLGFKPAWVMVKRTDSSDAANWMMYDNKRLGYNGGSRYLIANDSGAAGGSSDNLMDFTSNGFKPRSASQNINRSATYIYMAFAESPFVNSNGVPNNAR